MTRRSRQNCTALFEQGTDSSQPLYLQYWSGEESPLHAGYVMTSSGQNRDLTFRTFAHKVFPIKMC